MRKGWMLALLVLVFATSTARATTVAGVEFYGSSNSFALGPWATDLVDGARSEGHLTNDPTKAMSGGAGLRARGNGWMASLDYETLPVEMNIEAQRYGGTRRLMGDMTASVVEANVGFMVGNVKGFAVGFGGGVGIYSLSGGVQIQDEYGDFMLNRTMEGTTVGGQFMGMVEANLGGQFALIGAVGHRGAKVSQPISDGVNLPIEVDYSGTFGRVGFALYLSK